ncbi:uncharacterized protein LOC125372534 [Haliotis rufescens]|uniref:uncharacterized protein LOC125372534 n=1 Tax=Haliotis rufescens TaxID=6454 RepID=UPI00201EB8C1|nr:uncharacterized protein LOC125372534 [Haliotis rufescens]
MTYIYADSYGVNIGLPTGCEVFFLSVLVSHYICFRKGIAARRDNLTDDAEQPPSVEYQAWHKYYDIEEEDMDVGRQIQNGCQENYEEVRDLASAAIVHRPAKCTDNQACSDCYNTGQCKTGCHTGYYDLFCRSKCNTACKNNACKGNGDGIEVCTDGCIPGYDGKNCNIKCENNYTLNDTFCLDMCNQHCRLKSNTNDTSRCLVHGESASVFCTSECHNQSGECLHGCVGGWYGPRCSSQCSAGCSGGRCDAAGACVDGCRPGYFGRDRCRNHTCSSHNGSCVDGCIPGYYGESCNHSCEVCREGICDQMTGTCVNGCDVSERGCKPSCTSNCSRDYCLHAQTCDTDSKSNGVNIGLPTGCVVFILGVLVSHYICYRKGLAARRSVIPDRPGDDAEQPPSVEYQAWHKYYDIEEEDMDVGRQIENGCQEKYEEVRDLGMPVIADVFPAAPAIVHRGDDTSSSTFRSCDPEIQNGNPEEDLDLVKPVIADVFLAAPAIVHRGDDTSSESSASSNSRSYDPVMHKGDCEEEIDLAMPVIADVFPAAPAIVHRGDETSSESTTSSSSRSYTHLIPDVVPGDPRTADAEHAVEYQSRHKYYEIVEDDTDAAPQTQKLVMPVIADVFPAAPAIVHRGDDTSSESTTSSTSRSYTHLIRDVVTGDPRTAQCADNQACSGCDETGQCTTECHTGYFGRKCKSPCNPACKNNACKGTGNGIEECTEGCIPGYGGVNCDIQYSKSNGVNIGLPTGCVVFILGVLVSHYICYRKGLAARRDRPGDDAVQPPSVEYQAWHKYCDIEEEDMDAGGQIQNGCQENYEEVRDLGMPVIAGVFPAAPAIVHRGDDSSSEISSSSTSRSCDPEIQNGNPEEDLDLGMSVIADVFPAAPAIVHRGDDTSSESTTSSSSRSYTHLIPDVVTEDPRTGDTYLSPVEDVVLTTDV